MINIITTRARGFEPVKGAEDVKLPVRATKSSAGYDFFANEDVTIPALSTTPVLIKTGVKAYMREDEYLLLANRSSNPKKGLVVANGVGIVDADYYSNPNNDGEIMFAFINISSNPININKGDKLGQGIFHKYFLADNDIANGIRQGGFGSTDTNDSVDETKELEVEFTGNPFNSLLDQVDNDPIRASKNGIDNNGGSNE